MKIKTAACNEENKEKSKRIFRFSFVGLVVIFLNAVLDFIRGLSISAALVLLLALTLIIILIAVRYGRTRGTLTAIVLSTNVFLVLIAFAEGLNTGCYLFILSLLFALPFLMSSYRIAFTEIAFYLVTTVCAFCICILFCKNTSNWQYISPEMYSQIFTVNSICVVSLCSLFAFMGIRFEVRYREQLLTAKNKAEMQEQKIKKQNDHLQHIAFMNAHIVRSPLANILALTSLIDINKVTDSDNKELIQFLQSSAQQLDDNIREIVAKTSDK